jgi:hypothetical protein
MMLRYYNLPKKIGVALLGLLLLPICLVMILLIVLLFGILYAAGYGR